MLPANMRPEIASLARCADGTSANCTKALPKFPVFIKLAAVPGGGRGTFRPMTTPYLLHSWARSAKTCVTRARSHK